MPARSRALAPLTTAAVALALLTGCTDGTDTADPTPVPTSVPTTRVATPTLVPTPTPTPTPTAVDLTVPPVRPAAMETPSADGAAAAASYFISLYAYAYATGDYTQWDSLAAPNCEFCSSVRADIVGLHAQGRHRIGRIEVTSASGIELDPRHWYSATLHVVVAPAEDYDADGAVVDNHGEEVQDVGVALTWSDGWIVDEVGPTGPRG